MNKRKGNSRRIVIDLNAEAERERQGEVLGKSRVVQPSPVHGRWNREQLKEIIDAVIRARSK
jgi:hypothetical protein